MKKYFFSILFLLVSIIIVISCDTGLGEEVDLQAPEITVAKMTCYEKDDDGNFQPSGEPVKSFETTLYTKKNVTFEGTAFDNSGDVTVHAEIKWVGDKDYSFFKNISGSGTDWSLSIQFEKEGACWLKFVSEDKRGNYGVKSSKIVTLFVDEEGPVGEAFYIDRKVNGIQYSLKDIDSLKAIIEADPELNDPSNSDVAQNGEFLICGTFSDASGIADGTTLDLYDESDRKVVTGIPIYSDEDVVSSNYAPKFLINGEQLGLPSEGKHYYQICYNAKDLVKDPAPNETIDAKINLGWFLWWPESDYPKCSIVNLKATEDSINIHTGDALNITVFDDDALTETVECVLTGKTTISKKVSISSETQREANIIIAAPGTPQNMVLTVTAKDKYQNDLLRTVNVYVQDDFVPTIILTEPENNQIPAVTGTNADIKFAGITLDKSSCKYIEFVWVPDQITTNTEGKKYKAQAWLNSIAESGTHVSFDKEKETVKVVVTEGDDDFAGLKMWSARLTEEEPESLFSKYSFGFTVSLLNDFGFETNRDKYILCRVTRDDGNFSEIELKLAADNIAPEIVPVSPAGNMAIIDQDSDLVIKFKGLKSNGVEMKLDSYKLSYVDKDNRETLLAGFYDGSEKVYKSPIISKETLSQFAADNIIPKYKMEVEDKLGNKSSVVYSFIISALPSIKTVTSSAPAKNKMGDEILINVSFSKPVFCGKETVLKLKGIKNDLKGTSATTVIPAEYSSGSGSTTLVFKYTVQEGDYIPDTVVGLQVYNESGIGPIEGIDAASVHLDQLTAENNLQAKRASNPILMDGVLPKVTGVTVYSPDIEVSNKVDTVSYLREGRTIVANITTDKKITVQGAPKFYLKNGSKVLTLSWQSISLDGKTLQFSKKVSSSDVNGSYVYDNDEYLSEKDVLKDEYGNELYISSKEGTTDAKITIDTVKPVKPDVLDAVKKTTLIAGRYKDSLSFTVTALEGAKTEYSLDGGNNWNVYSSEVKITSDASIIARITDNAGNISDYSSPVNVQVESTFPDYIVECTNSDGNYKLNSVLEFKVSFDRPVIIPANSAAFITLSGINGSDTVTAGAKAELIDKTAHLGEGVTEALFRYTTQADDNFNLKIAANAVTLTGFMDLYGIEQGTKSLKAAYTRSGIRCDSIAPSVTVMTPQGTKTTQNGLNAYTNGKKIVLKFNENVNVVSGKIYLRQTEGWAIPPMLSAKDFNTVLSAAKNADIDTARTYGLTASQVLYMDGMEDAENLYSSLVGAANDRYHGTAQYVGPYKKMTNGIDGNGKPVLDVTYVLDYGVDIWNSADSTKEYFGKTFEPNWSLDGTKYTYITYHKIYQSGWVHVITPENRITTDSIRHVLEQAHYHERYMAVNSTFVEVSGNTVTLNFPEGLLGETDLPKGRQWELVIEKGAFMDDAGNYFGAENGIVDKTSEAFVLIKDGTNSSFMSAGVETPVIRVDRYSYGLGIKQPKSISGNTVTYEQIETIGNANREQTGTTAPTAKVAVKIDCESRGASVRYSINSDTKGNTDCSSTPNRQVPKDGVTVKTYPTTTTVTIPSVAATDTKATKTVFLAGSGDYTKSYKGYITADAYSGSVVSEKAHEGVFQTVVDYNRPNYAGNNGQLWNSGAGKNIVNIHGTTGTGGVPSISPYPLRDQPVSSAYMRQTYKNGNQYYWVSYEVLEAGIFSMYSYGKCGAGANVYATGNSAYWSDWSPGYGKMEVGEFVRCDSMLSYTQNY